MKSTPALFSALFLSLWLVATTGCTGAESPRDATTGAQASATPASESGSNADGGPAAEVSPAEEPVAGGTDPETPETEETMTESKPVDEQVVTLGAGCFWCIEAVLEQIDGVLDVQSGYMGGHVENPTYEEVCSKTTGHAEVVQVRFDANVLSFEQLLDWFWKLHDPTQVDRQGPDEGPQYRSAIFYHSEEQRRIAEESKAREQDSGRHLLPIATEITEASTFYVAEEYHQDYYSGNKRQGYCRMVIAPKLDKLGLDK